MWVIRPRSGGYEVRLRTLSSALFVGPRLLATSEVTARALIPSGLCEPISGYFMTPGDAFELACATGAFQ